MHLTEDQSNSERKKNCESRNYHRTMTQRNMIIEKLRDHGCRITKQRMTIIDIILGNDCSCCKEIYYKASQIDSKIGSATVYRMVNSLEEIGAISRKNMYRVAYSGNCLMEDAATVVLDDNTSYNLSAKQWNAVIKAGLCAFGYLENQNIASITIKQCECDNMDAGDNQMKC